MELCVSMIAWRCWHEIPLHFDVEIDQFIVMPDHVHGILILPDKPDNHPLHEIVGLYKSSVARLINSHNVRWGHDPTVHKKILPAVSTAICLTAFGSTNCAVVGFDCGR